MQALSKTKQGKSYTIKWLFGQQEVLDFMRRCQIQEGSEIRVIHKDKNGMIIGAQSRRLAIETAIADRIQV